MYPQQLNKTLISLKIMTIFYYILRALLLGLELSGVLVPSEQLNISGIMFMSGFVFVLGYFFQKVNSGLRQDKYWAWISAIILSGMMSFSLFFILGVIGLMGLLSKETRQHFNQIG